MQNDPIEVPTRYADIYAALGKPMTAEDWVEAAGYWLKSPLSAALPEASPMFKALVDVLGECKRRGDSLRAAAAPVRCAECDIALDEARAGNATEAAPRYGGLVMCGGCRDAADLRAENKRLRKLLADAEPFIGWLAQVPDLKARVRSALEDE